MEAEASYNILLVILSYLVSVFGSYTALQLASGIPRAQGGAVGAWTLSSALALGGGAIWSMHFIAMLAYETPMKVGYDIGLTFLSLLIAVAVVAIGIYIAGKFNSLLGLMLAGVITGTGVSAMHYTGMAAMVMPAKMQYDQVIVSISVMIGIAASTAALWLAFNVKGHIQRFGSAIIMGIAVSGMHYTGMAGMTMVHTGEEVAINSTIAPLTLGLMIFCFTMLILVLCLLVALSQFNRAKYDGDEAGDDETDIPLAEGQT